MNEKPLTRADMERIIDAHYAGKEEANRARAATAAAAQAVLVTAQQAAPAVDPPLETLTNRQKLELGLKQSQSAREQARARSRTPEQIKADDEFHAQVEKGNHTMSATQLKIYQGLRESNNDRGPRPAA
jgi:hypothetical protein